MPKRAATVRKKSGYRFCSVIVFCDFRVWGEQPPFTVRLFVEIAEGDRQKPHRGIEPRCDCLNSILTGVLGVALTRPAEAVTRPGEAVTRRADVLGGARTNATFSIFSWLQVANFDVFLFLVLHVVICPLLDWLFVLCHRTANDARP